jgi:hypothetical protein
MTITKVEAQDAIPELFLREAIGRLNERLMLTRLIPKDASAAVAQLGDSVRVVKRGAVTAKLKTAGLDIVPDSPANTKVNVVLDQHGYVSWEMEDVVRAETIEDALAYFQDALPALAEQIEGYIFGLYTDAGVAPVAPPIGAIGVDIDDALVLDLGLEVDTAKWPVEDRWLIVSAKDKKNLLSIQNMIDQSIRGDLATQALREAVIGRLYGWNIMQSNLVAFTGGTTYHNMAFNPTAFMLASRALPAPPAQTGALSTVVSDPETGLTFRYVQAYSAKSQTMVHTIDVLYGAKVVDDRVFFEVLS